MTRLQEVGQGGRESLQGGGASLEWGLVSRGKRLWSPLMEVLEQVQGKETSGKGTRRAWRLLGAPVPPRHRPPARKACLLEEPFLFA